MNSKTTNDDQQSVNMTCAENDSWDDTETDMHMIIHLIKRQTQIFCFQTSILSLTQMRKIACLAQNDYITWLFLTI